MNGERYQVSGRYIVSVNDSNAYVGAALAGFGAIHAPAFMVQHHIDTGALRRVLDGWTSDHMPLHVVYPPNAHLSNKLRVFVDWVADLFASHELIRRRQGGD